MPSRFIFMVGEILVLSIDFFAEIIYNGIDERHNRNRSPQGSTRTSETANFEQLLIENPNSSKCFPGNNWIFE